MARLERYAPSKGARVYFAGAADNVREVLRRAGLEARLLGDCASSRDRVSGKVSEPVSGPRRPTGPRRFTHSPAYSLTHSATQSA